MRHVLLKLRFSTQSRIVFSKSITDILKDRNVTHLWCLYDSATKQVAFQPVDEGVPHAHRVWYSKNGRQSLITATGFAARTKMLGLKCACEWREEDGLLLITTTRGYASGND